MRFNSRCPSSLDFLNLFQDCLGKPHQISRLYFPEQSGIPIFASSLTVVANHSIACQCCLDWR